MLRLSSKKGSRGGEAGPYRLACLNPIEQPEGLARVPQSLWDQEWEAEEEDGREAEMTLSLLFTPGAPSLLTGPGFRLPTWAG